MENCINYEVIWSEKKGKIVVATCDIKKGTSIILQPPLLVLEAEEIEKMPGGKKDQINIFLLLYKKFALLNYKIKNAILNLYGELDESLGEIKEFDKIFGSLYQNIFDLEILRKLTAVYKFNSFSDREGNLYLCNDISRISHSCKPNSTILHSKENNLCKSISDIKCGDEITISYNEKYNTEPIYWRKHVYQKTKAFVCECIRCKSDYDDTRQVACEYCKSFTSIYQINDFQEPYLLKCMECEKEPTEDYKNKVLNLEKNAREINAEITKKIKSVMCKNSLDCVRILREIFLEYKDIEIMYRHELFKDILLKLVEISFMIVTFDNPRLLDQNMTKFLMYSSLYIDSHEKVIEYPNERGEKAYYFVADKILSLETIKSEHLSIARDFLNKAIQYNKLLSKKINENYNKLMLKICKNPNYIDNILFNQNMCNFCGDIGKYKCGKCGKIEYCSRECQVMHWCIHKKVCN